MEQEEPNLLRWFARHFVRLGWLAYPPGTPDPVDPAQGQPGSASCFVLSVRGEWFLITAGHVLEEIAEARRLGQVMRHWFLDDTTSEGARHSIGVPFAFEAAPTFRQDVDGVDYGFIHLRPLYREALKKNGIIALDEDAWRKRTPADFDEYCLLGVPWEGIGPGTRPQSFQKWTVLFPLEPVELTAVPDEMRQKRFPRFFARLPDRLGDDTFEMKTIKGMSGGPIFGIKDLDGERHYWVIALQSGWDKSSRIIAGCYIRFFGEVIAQALTSLEAAGSDT